MEPDPSWIGFYVFFCFVKKVIDNSNMSCYDISHNRYVVIRYNRTRHK